MVLGHRRRVFEGFQPFQLRLPGAFQQPASQVGGMPFMEPRRGFRQLKEFGQSLVQPERQAGDDGMQIAVRRFVPQVFSDPLLPGGEDGQGGIGLDKAGPPCRKLREVPTHEGLIVLQIGEQVEVDRFVRDR
jgi:hypothetical protein